MISPNGHASMDAFKSAFEQYIEHTQPLLLETADAKRVPEWFPGDASVWSHVCSVVYSLLRQEGFRNFLTALKQGWTLDELRQGALEKGREVKMSGEVLDMRAPPAPDGLVNEARRLWAALLADPMAMQRYDAEPGRKHALSELAGGALLGPSTRGYGLCRDAAEALGELTTLAPAAPAAPIGTTLTRDSLAKEAKVLRRDLRAADYKELAVQFGSNVSAVRRDLLDVATGREDGPILRAAKLVHLAKLVLQERATPAGAKG